MFGLPVPPRSEALAPLAEPQQGEQRRLSKQHTRTWGGSSREAVLGNWAAASYASLPKLQSCRASKGKAILTGGSHLVSLSPKEAVQKSCRGTCVVGDSWREQSQSNPEPSSDADRAVGYCAALRAPTITGTPKASCCEITALEHVRFTFFLHCS